MPPSAHGSPVTLDLTAEEAWVLHAGVLHYLKREAARGEPAPDALALLNALERETSPSLDADGLRLVRAVLVEYVADAPPRDRAACRRILSQVRRVVG